MKKFFSFCLLIAIGVLALTGCGVETQPPAPTATETRPPPTFTQTSAATLTQTFTPTFTQTPTLSMTPTITLTPGPTRTPAPTRTPIPTLSTTEERNEYAFNLIRTNGMCKLPCFLGIEAGTSIWQDVKLLFRPLSHRKIPESGETGYKYSYSHFFQQFGHNYLLFKVDMEGDWQVQAISANFELDPNFVFVRYDYRLAVMESLSLPEILEDLGVPSSVYIHGPYQYEPDSGIMASMVLIYEDAGISIDYFMSSFTSRYSEAHGFCFIEDWLKNISLKVISPEGDTTLLDHISGQIATSNWRNFTDVSELTLEEFYTIGVSVEPDPCFRLKNP